MSRPANRFYGGTGSRGHLMSRLGSVLEQRDLGLITQIEYEERLEQIRGELTPKVTVTERELSCGGTSFVIRDIRSGEVYDLFELRRVYRPDR